MGRKQQSEKPCIPFERVEITGSCGLRDDDGEVTTREMRGLSGRVCPRNANYTNREGVAMVGMRLGDQGQGGLLAVPRAALRRGGTRSFLAIGADAWQRIFGRN